MAEQHRATAKQWLAMELDGRNFAVASCLLELRDRIEALEAAQPAKSNHPTKPDSSLVERVAFAIAGDSAINWKPEARAAIREVAAWLREQKVYGVGWVWAVERLEEEAER